MDWERLCRNPQDYEDLIKLLLQRLHPDGQVIDGRGGDGGREFQVSPAGALKLFEAKSFTGRLGSAQNRRGQVRKSLISAAQHQPDTWDLVVPIDPTEGELAWFNRLRDGFPFVGSWRGRTWLDERLAAHDDLIRSTRTVRDELLELAGQYNMETAALTGGIPALLDRHHALEARANELSNYWRPVILGRADDGATMMTLEAKSPDAAEKEPITFQIGVDIPTTSNTEALREQLRSHIDFGTGVDIPGTFVSRLDATGPPGLGLPGSDVEPGRLWFGDVRDTDNLPAQTLAVYEPGAAFPIATLPFQTEVRTRGQRGSRFVAHDDAHSIQLITEVPRDAPITLHLRGHDPGPVTPAAILPGMRLIHALQPLNVLHLTVRNGESEAVEVLPLPAGTSNAVSTEVLGYIEDLAAIQDALRQSFPTPGTLTRQDIDLAKRLRGLLDDKFVPWLNGGIRVTLDPKGVAEFKSQFPGGAGTLGVSSDNVDVHLAGHVLHLGPLFMLGSVTVDLDTVADDPPAGQELTVTFTAAGDGWFHARRGFPPGLPPQPGPTRNQGRSRVFYAGPEPLTAVIS